MPWLCLRVGGSLGSRAIGLGVGSTAGAARAVGGPECAAWRAARAAGRPEAAALLPRRPWVAGVLPPAVGATLRVGVGVGLG